MTDKGFAGKIAIFNAGEFAFGVAGITYVDARLTTHLLFQARIYPGGYLVAVLGGMFILITTYLTLFKSSSWKVNAGLPSVIVLLVGALSIPFFRPELPHAGLVVWTILISVVSLLTCFIRLVPFATDWFAVQQIAQAARIERVKEYANLWRMIFVSSTFGTIALVLPWSQFVWAMPSVLVTDHGEQVLLGNFGALGIAVICAYAVFGVIYESFCKTNLAADLLRLINESLPSPGVNQSQEAGAKP